MEMVAGPSLPPGRWEELRQRLMVLLADFDELKALESAALEPLPAFRVEREDGDDRG
jgi:hypothetical protein